MKLLLKLPNTLLSCFTCTIHLVLIGDPALPFGAHPSLKRILGKLQISLQNLRS